MEAVWTVSDSKGVGEVAGYMADSRSAGAAVPDRGTVGWDLVEDTLNLFQVPYPGPVLYPCLSVPGGDSPVGGSPGVAEEALAGILVG